MKAFPRKLRMFVKRKDTFQDASEEAHHKAMLKGVRRFLASLHEQGLCAFMDYDRVRALLPLLLCTRGSVADVFKRHPSDIQTFCYVDPRLCCSSDPCHLLSYGTSRWSFGDSGR